MVEFPSFYRPDDHAKSNTERYLEEDTRWKILPPDFQSLVLQTADDVIKTPRDLLPQKMLVFDAGFDPYSQHLTQEISMVTLRSHIEGYLAEQKWMSLDARGRLLEQLLRITLAERLLGKQIAERYSWESETGFGINELYTTYAIDICKSIVRNS